MLQNRVDPWGQLHAIAHRGTLMGNRGILHDEQNRIVRPWAHKSWVTCLLSFKDIKRPKPFSTGNYSELFFIDEATAFAAGHRPCTYCQRDRSQQFKAAWLKANLTPEQQQFFKLSALDAQLHKERVIRGGAKVTHQAVASSLPKGSIFEHGGVACLVHSTDCYLPWSFSGYGTAIHLPPNTTVTVLTPKSVVLAFEHGFEPQIHPSANATP